MENIMLFRCNDESSWNCEMEREEERGRMMEITKFCSRGWTRMPLNVEFTQKRLCNGESNGNVFESSAGCLSGCSGSQRMIVHYSNVLVACDFLFFHYKSITLTWLPINKCPIQTIMSLTLLRNELWKHYIPSLSGELKHIHFVTWNKNERE